MNIWVLDSARRERQVTSGPGGDYQPDWSPDEAALVFFSARGGNTDIWRGAARRYGADSSDREPGARHQPRLLAGRTADRVRLRPERTIRGLADAGRWTGQKQVASVGCWGHFVAWTADSRAIVFRGELDRQMQIYRVDVASGALTPLPPVRSGGHMSFSPSQSLIMDVSNHKVLWAHPLGGAEPYEGLSVPRSRRAHRLPALVARRAASSVRSGGSAGGRPLDARGVLTALSA